MPSDFTFEKISIRNISAKIPGGQLAVRVADFSFREAGRLLSLDMSQDAVKAQLEQYGQASRPEPYGPASEVVPQLRKAFSAFTAN